MNHLDNKNRFIAKVYFHFKNADFFCFEKRYLLKKLSDKDEKIEKEI
jgi:hypothetical protein